MQYRHLGTSGLRVSEVCLGSWLTYGNATDDSTAEAIVDKAFELGINFFDCANVYAGGEAGLARIQLDKAPSEAQLAAIRENANILSATLSTITRRM